MTTKLLRFTFLILIALAIPMLCLAPMLAQAEMIHVLYTGSLIDATGDSSGRTETLSFDAGAIADKLVVQVAGEGGNIASYFPH